MTTERQQHLFNIIEMTLDCEELPLLPYRREALEDALERLNRGQHMTQRQAGYWSQVILQIRKDN